MFFRHVGSIFLDELFKTEELGFEAVDLLKGKVLHFLKNPTMMTFQLSDTVIILLTNFKNLVIEVLFYSGDLKD